MDFKDFYTKEVEFYTKSLQKNIQLYTNRGTPLHRIDLSFSSLGDRYQKLLDENSLLNELGSTYIPPADRAQVIDNTANRTMQNNDEINAVYEENHDDGVQSALILEADEGNETIDESRAD